MPHRFEPKLYFSLETADDLFQTLYSFTTSDNLRPFLTAPLQLRQFHLPNAYDRVHEDAWHRADRGFLTMINANKLPRIYVRELYSERLLAIEYFNRRREIDLYGVGSGMYPPTRWARAGCPGRSNG